jgi:hypothetical protein
VGELLIAIQIYIDAHNADPKPFVWTASAETMLGDPEPSPDMPPGTVRHLRAREAARVGSRRSSLLR